MEGKQVGLRDLFSMQFTSPGFSRELLKVVGDQQPDACFQCMKCSSGCDALKFQGDFRPHQLVGLARLGLRDRLLNAKLIWSCTTCSYCREVCPQDVSPVDVIKALRRMAVKEGQLLEDHRKIAGYLFKTGHLVPVNEEVMELRKKLGLSSVPPTTHAHPQSLEEVKKLLRATKFVEIIGGGGGSDR